MREGRRLMRPRVRKTRISSPVRSAGIRSSLGDSREEWRCDQPSHCMWRIGWEPNSLRTTTTQYSNWQDFPDARFIIIWRDPAAICRSILDAAKGRSSWFTRRWMIVRTLLGFRVLKERCNRALSLGAHLHQVQFEEFVKDPVRTMKEVCRFLDVPFVAKVASF